MTASIPGALESAPAEGSLRQRTKWTLADQALSSLTNFGVGIVIARATGPTTFGIFSIAFATYTFGLGAVRALASDPLAIRYSAIEPSKWREGTREATGAAVAVGVLFGFGSLVAAAIAGGNLRAALAVLAIGFPGLLVQDCWRYAFIAAGRGALAFLNDLIWAVVMFPVLVIVASAGGRGVAAFVVVWAGAANLAAVAGALQLHAFPDPRGPRRWWRQHRDLIIPYLAEFATTNGVGQLLIYLITATIGLTAIAAIRASQIVFGPLNVLLTGAALAAVPEGVRMLRKDVRKLTSFSVVISLSLAVLILAWGATLALLPRSVGSAVMGRVWDVGQPVILPFSVWMACSALTAGALTGLRALAAARRSVKARMLGSVLVMVGGLTGTAFGAVVPAVWGIAAGSALAAAVWWRQLLLGTAEYST